MSREDSLGDRVKLYESKTTSERLVCIIPTIARLDGKNFSNLTKELEKPYDKIFTEIMVNVTEFLVRETGALCGYTQSDEITLLFYSDNLKSSIFFDGKLYKMISILASMATVRFSDEVSGSLIDEKVTKYGMFDCRVFQVPSKAEAANVFLWRELDATRNSIQSAGHFHFSHKSLHKLSCNEIQEKLILDKGINWNDYPPFFKRGTFLQRYKHTRKFTEEELKSLPDDHNAKNNPDLKIERSDIRKIELDKKFLLVKNKIDFIFNGEQYQ